MQRTVLQPLCQVPSSPKRELHSSLVVQKIFQISVNHLAICKVSTHFFQKHVMFQQPALSPAAGLCLGAREGHGLPEEPRVPGGPWVRGWGHSVLAIRGHCLLVGGQLWVVGKGVQGELLMPPEDVG